MRFDPVILPANVSASVGQLEDDSPAYILKLQTGAFELNVWVRSDEIAVFDRVRQLSPDDRAVRIGTASGVPVFWAAGEGHFLYVLVGFDDVTWDTAVLVSIDVLDDILREVAKCPLGPRST